MKIEIFIPEYEILYDADILSGFGEKSHMFSNLMMIFISGIISRILCSWCHPLELYVLKSSKCNCSCHRNDETYEINPSMSVAHGSAKCTTAHQWQTVNRPQWGIKTSLDKPKVREAWSYLPGYALFLKNLGYSLRGSPISTNLDHPYEVHFCPLFLI